MIKSIKLPVQKVCPTSCEIDITQGKTYLALQNDFVLKVDGNKPILYPFDFLEPNLFVITPLQAFAISLLTGCHKFHDIEHQFHKFFPSAAANAFRMILSEVDNIVRSVPTRSGIGANGVFERSEQPIEIAYRYDPRKFVINEDLFSRAMNDIHRLHHMELPINITAIFTNRCQTNCVYCYAERPKVPEISLERWKELIKEMRNLEIQLISLDYGDVFARKDGIDFLECLLQHKMHFLISTKSLVTRDDIRRLLLAGFAEKVRNILARRVQISIDTLDDDMAAELTGSNTFKDNIIRTFDNFMTFGITPTVRSVMTPKNANQPKKLVDFFYKKGARCFRFVKYIRSLYKHNANLFLDKNSIETIKMQLEEIRNKYPDIDIRDNMDLIDPGNNEISAFDKQQIWEKSTGCNAGLFTLGISADGHAFLCEPELEKKYCLGDLRRQSIQEVWNSERMFEFIYPTRDRFSGTICYSCEEFELCWWERGCCYRDAYFCYGSIYDAPPLCPKQSKPGVRFS